MCDNVSITYILQVIERTCVEITSIDPGRLCVDRNSTDITLQGRGFTINLNRRRAACRFKNGSQYIGKTASHCSKTSWEPTC